MDSLPNQLKGLIGPSILNADLSMLADESRRLLDSGADYLHLDVMDGHFVPNLTIGHPVIKCLRNNIPKVYFDAHMMVSEPERWINDMAGAGVNQYTFHKEATTSENIHDIIRKIKEADMKVGLGIKPGTPVHDIGDLINDIDVVLIMTVEPGFGGQKFMSGMMDKVRWLRKHYPQLLHIEIDGGINLATIYDCAHAGANMIVSGSALIQSKQANKDIEQMRQIIDENLRNKKLNIQLSNDQHCSH
ncbi:unnamed protein product [Rotaria magnacalcarata]|uniref:Ribulose-phosphate 3-epimerase n=1 Tax=Rotaria magnacalcarata TaxID=392030 RepID=A0A819CHU9_9BILA|nr:unnamed protein product [Rotaria magnacalcarata]CAF2256029.1 unnamed protein product [Rotaria magnacalcarata]CAF3820088.1 unnamed protein product [Rotaria magnacalcarata]CAF3934510.1 unnamed protein product [Rotaria magnacalcarata]